MPIEEILDQLDELIDRSWSLPLTGGRCVVDADKVRELLDDVRLNLPTEIRQAQSIVADRTAIVEEAKKEAEAIIARAEKRAAALVDEQEIVRQSKNKAAEITQQAQQQSREMRQSAKDFVDGILKNTEETLAASLTEVKGTRSAAAESCPGSYAAPAEIKAKNAALRRFFNIGFIPTGHHKSIKNHRKSKKTTTKKPVLIKTGFFVSTFHQSIAKTSFFRIVMPKN